MKRPLNVFPGEWAGIEEYETEWKKNLKIGDKVKVIIDSQFRDYYSNSNNRIPRSFHKIGVIINIDFGDEWAYQLRFTDGDTNWFKRYHLKKM